MWSLPSDPLLFLLVVVDLAPWTRVYKLTILLLVCPRDRGSPSPASLNPLHPSHSGTKTQRSPASHHFGIPASTLGPFKWIWTLLRKSTRLPECSEHATLLSISLRPSLVLWIKFKILPLVFIALYNLWQLPLAHNCCNDLSVVAIHSYTPKSTPLHISMVCADEWKIEEQWKPNQACIFVKNVRFHVPQDPSHARPADLQKNMLYCLEGKQRVLYFGSNDFRFLDGAFLLVISLQYRYAPD